METIKASSKGQIVIPKAIREELAIRPGTELAVEVLDEHSFKVEVTRLSHEEQVDRLAGCLARYGRGKRGSARGDDAAIMRSVSADDERTRGRKRRR